MRNNGGGGITEVLLLVASSYRVFIVKPDDQGQSVGHRQGQAEPVRAVLLVHLDEVDLLVDKVDEQRGADREAVRQAGPRVVGEGDEVRDAGLCPELNVVLPVEGGVVFYFLAVNKCYKH